jgi:hypothetical protein
MRSRKCVVNSTLETFRAASCAESAFTVAE